MAQKALGTKLKIGANSIADLTSINGVEITVDTIDVTTLDDTFREFLDTLADGGEISFAGYFNPADTNGQKTLYDRILGGANPYTILFPTAMGAEWQVNAIITSLGNGAELEDAISFEGTMKVTGEPSLGLTASGGLTALSLASTGGSLTPAFGAAVRYYAYTGVTGADVTVTATAADHTIQLFVDGVFNQTLTSGSASTAIALSIGTKKLTLIAFEAGKTQQVTDIVVEKAS